jgi:phospholipase C
MRRLDFGRYALSSCMAAAMLAACGGLQPPIRAPGAMSQSRVIVNHVDRTIRSPIHHIIVLVQEERSFNDLFVTTKYGCALVGHRNHKKYKMLPLKEVGLADSARIITDYYSYRAAYDKGSMCGFNLEGAHLGPYQYVNPAQIRPYWTAADEYALADHMFQTQGSGDFTAHQDLVRGGTEVSSTESVIDRPDKYPWDCDAPPGTTTSLITTKLEYILDGGPFPCFSYDTLGTLLDAKSISWKYYTPTQPSTWDAFDAINIGSEERAKHISRPETHVLLDIAAGTLPSMSWVIPARANSDSPSSKADGGPAWVAKVVDAIGQSAYWNSAAIVVVWDDWGGFYDPVPPPFLDHQGGAGFRVPMLVISPYVPQGEVSHTVYGFGSIVRFIEDTWHLGRLGTTDKTSTSIGDMFDFNQAPRQFVKI